MTRILRGLSVGTFVAVLSYFLARSTISDSLTADVSQLTLESVLGATAQWLACATGSIALLTMANRRQWGWFGCVLVLMAVAAYSTPLAEILLPYLSNLLVHPGEYVTATYILTPASVAAAVLVYTLIHKQGHTPVISEEGSDIEISSADDTPVQVDSH